MLPKHPDQLSNVELEAWVRHLVDEQVSEGPRLDYKEIIELEGGEKKRLEAAKDISSFANEIGGTLVYGIPEDRRSDELAMPCKPYGLDPLPNIESRLENVYVDSIQPRLPEWRIRRVDLTEYAGKVVYVVWSPESWLGPHMIQAYGDKRYYRRGQLRAVPMGEHEVRQRYERRRALRSAVDDFLGSSELNYVNGLLAGSEFVTRCVVCPVLLPGDSVDFGLRDMREWLDGHAYGSRKWIPSSSGVRTQLPSGGGGLSYSHMYGNGAVTHIREAEVDFGEGSDKHYLAYIAEFQEMQRFLQFVRAYYERISYYGPLVFDVMTWSAHGNWLWLPPGPRRRGQGHRLVTHDGMLRIRIAESNSALWENPNFVLKRLADEVFRAFGVWEADCFDEVLNLRTN